MKANQLQVNQIHLNIGGVSILNDVSFSLSEGERIGLVGPNGAGKTSVINCITQFEKRYQGEITFADKLLNKENPQDLPKYKIIRTFQNLGLFNELTVLDNFYIAAHRSFETNMKNIIKLEREVKREALKLLENETIELGDIVSDLSYGQQKIVEFLCALIQRPSILILDEPAAGLNDFEKSRMIEMILRKQSEFNFSLLVVEHDVNFVSTLCQNVVVLQSGELLCTGCPEEVFQRKEVIQAWIGESNG
ncbi:branched-chain amino acid transport system ATP-binding protein [Neobacillus bataviensis LMG 21833]|uniref:Branched-chain amino acid transport system ATP-binding protein n=1 Tax=Neobacillus bataviensis LMG 21833 TaxID=1117379 RepID=K6CKJ3_9BACI|nr:ATP-binding cassette domain-containing protein [Neobacillus bataviensis]EKN71675.1 branched-chain amino acid transport system ATP-binding protein [Neobacillus bataviensis LMG 21833]